VGAAHLFSASRLQSDRRGRMSSAESGLASGPGEELGRVLVRLREERGLSQKQVADQADISNSTLSRLESGDRGVSREVLDRICVALKLDRHEELELLTAAGVLNPDAAQILADDDVAQIARVLHAPAVSPDDARLLRQYLRLALAHAKALGYKVE
jgi:transcriptional regulator with XRE-family HTH domain